MYFWYEKAVKKYDSLFRKRDNIMIVTIIEFSIFAIALLIFIGLINANIITSVQNNKLKANLTQESIDKAIVMQEMQKLMAEIDSKNSNQNDGFLKFVSDSREAAFKYIEDVQDSLVNLQEAVGILKSNPINAADRKKAIKIIQDALKYLPEDRP